MHDRYAYRPAGRDTGYTGPLDSRLSGTGRLADDLWLLAHHEVTGRPHLRPRQLGLGLAGGLLAELMTGPHPAIRLRHGGLLEICPEVPARAAAYADIGTCPQGASRR
jgi:Golgi phosphoprotein 3 (GPP34)